MSYTKLATFNTSALLTVITSSNSAIPYNIRLSSDDSLIVSSTLTSGAETDINDSGEAAECYVEIEPTDSVLSLVFARNEATGFWLDIETNYLNANLNNLTINDTHISTVDLSGCTTLQNLNILDNQSLIEIIWPEAITTFLNSVVITGNASLPAANQDTIIKGVWDNALTFLQTGKTLDLRNNATGISAQSEAYLAALLDDASFNWTVNGETTRTAWTITNNIADLQLMAVNLTSNIKLGQNIDAAVTHTWGSDMPDYTLVIPSGITTGTIAAITNGAITINGVAQTVCGVYFNTSNVLAGFYVTGNTATAGAIVQPPAPTTATFEASGCTVFPIKHFYRDLPANIYADEKAKILAGTLYDITDIDGTTYQPLVYNDNLSRIYYRGIAIPPDGVVARTGFVPIGQSTSFVGNFDSNGYEIRDCHVFSALANVGIIGYQDGVNSNGRTTTIKSTGHTIVGFGYTGTGLGVGLVGYNYRYRQVNNSYSIGSVYGTGNSATYIGGIVGLNYYSQVNNSYSTGSITGTGNSDTRIGGIVGLNYNYSQVNNSYSTGSVYGTGNSATRIGGIVGWNYNYSQVNNSYSTGSVYGTGNSPTYIGGIVGYNHNSSQVNNSYSTGSVYGTGNSPTYIGGIVGYNNTNSQVKNCFGYSAVSGLNGVNPLAVRGIYINSNSSIINCYQLGAVTPILGETSLDDTAGFRVKSNFAVQTSDYSTPHDPEATHAINAHVNSGGKYYVCITLIDAAALAANEGSIAITNTAFWLEDTGFDFVGMWRMMWDYPKLKIHQLQPVVLQQYINGDN